MKITLLILLLLTATGLLFYRKMQQTTRRTEQQRESARIAAAREAREVAALANRCWNAYVVDFRQNAEFVTWTRLFAGDGVFQYLQRLGGLLSDTTWTDFQKAQRIQAVLANGLHNLLTAQLTYDGRGNWEMKKNVQPSISREAYLFSLGIQPNTSSSFLMEQLTKELKHQEQMTATQRQQENYIFYAQLYGQLLPPVMQFCRLTEEDVTEDNAAEIVRRGQEFYLRAQSILARLGVVIRTYHDASAEEREDWFVKSSKDNQRPAIVRTSNQYIYCKGTF